MRLPKLCTIMGPGGESLQLVIGSSVGVGFVAGACYLLVCGFKWLGQRRKNATHCFICHQPFPTNLPSQGVICHICGHRICRPIESETIFHRHNSTNKCSHFDSKTQQWRCYNCYQSQSNSSIASSLSEKLQSLDEDFWKPTFHDGTLRRARMSNNDRESATSAQLEQERRRIREVLEGCAQCMVGGDLDDVSVGRIYAHAQYERMFARHHAVLSKALSNLATALHNSNKELPRTQFLSKTEEKEKSISYAELGLRDAIRRIAREASRLPCLANTSVQRALVNAGRETDTTYEDLLATAILNKVIDTYQKDNHAVSSESLSSHPSSSRTDSIHTNPPEGLNDLNLINDLDRRKIHRRGSFEYFGSRNSGVDDDFISLHSEPVYKTNDYHFHRNAGVHRRRNITKSLTDDRGSVSSIDDNISEFSRSLKRHPNENLAFRVKQSIDELTSSDVEDSAFDQQLDSDISEITSSLPRVYNMRTRSTETRESIPPSCEPWGENWLFQKKKNKSSLISTPVPMLVPKASTEYRALIGDRDAEDTTDLSDMGSDYDEPGKEIPKTDIKSVLVSSRKIIGGKNDVRALDEVFSEEETEPSEVKLSTEEVEEEIVDEIIVENVIESVDQDEETESYEAFKVNESEIKPVKSKIEKWDIFYQHDSPTHKSSINIEIAPSGEHKFESFDNESLTAEIDIHEAKNSTLLQDTPYSESDSLESNHQKDSDSNCNIYDESVKLDSPQDPDESVNRNSFNSSRYNYDSGIDINDPPPRKGTIAEREHKKWENAVPMPNNPYTPENIEKRLKQRSSSIISLPQVTPLERRNSYKREIDPKDLDDDNRSTKSYDSLNSYTNIKESAVFKMFENIVKDYSTPPTQHETEKSSDAWENKYASKIDDESEQKYLTDKDTLAYLNKNDLSKTQSCINLNNNKNEEARRTLSPQQYPLRRSSSASPQGIYLKDVLTSETSNGASHRFDRDYYIREAKRSSGSRKIKNDSSTSIELLNQVEPSSKEYEVYEAKPALAIESESDSSPRKTTISGVEVGELLSIEDSNSSYGSPNSSVDLQRIYNLNTGTVLYQKNKSTSATKNETTKSPSETPNSSPQKLKLPSVSPFLLNSSNESLSNKSISNGYQEVTENIQPRANDLISLTNSLEDVSQKSESESGISVSKKVEELEKRIAPQRKHRSFSSSDEASTLGDNEIEILEVIDVEEKTERKTVDAESEIIRASAPSVKERIKRFLSPDLLQSCSDDLHPNHSITARSFFRRANSACQMNIMTTESPLACKTNKSVETELNSKSYSDFPQKSLKERRAFFESLAKKL